MEYVFITIIYDWLTFVTVEPPVVTSYRATILPKYWLRNTYVLGETFIKINN